jgi:DNA polymerase-3 subunit alpha
MKNWVSLHNHTMFSLLDGCGRIEDLVAYAKKLNFPALAITDHGTCAGYLDFQSLCLEHKIKPLFGVECYISPFEMTLKGFSDTDKADLGDKYKDELRKRSKNHHLILIAKNDIGLKTIYKIITTANMVGFYNRPRIDYEFLAENHEGLICTTACIASKLNFYILKNDYASAFNEVKFLKGLFGDDLYLELEANNLEEQKVVNKALVAISEQFKIKTILANDIHYINADYIYAHEVLLKLNSNNENWTFSAKNLYLMDYDEFWKHIKQNHGYLSDKVIQKSLENTLEIADKCTAVVDVKSKKEPVYIPDKGSTEEFLQDLMQKGIFKRGIHKFLPEVKKQYLDRLLYEFQVIQKKGFIDYFLICWDFINYAKTNNILIGPGRGSVGGSLLAWVIGLIELDPIKYNLSFERFLNPERNKSPDIDTDMEDDRRNEIREYLAKKWGENCIAPIVAYSRYSGNSLFRDVCRLFNIDFMEYNEIAKTIKTTEEELKKLKPFSENVKDNVELSKFLLKHRDKDIEKLVTLMEGQIKNASIAAAGTIISNAPLQEILPLRRSKEEKLVTEWESMKLSSSGYLKMDLLGLKTLSILKDVLNAIGKDINWLYNLPTNDPKVYDYFTQCKTLAVFQFEGDGMTGLLKEVKPKSVEDLAVCSALYRPGPISNGLLSSYIHRRKGAEITTYIHDIAKDVLEDTFGIMIYQEQVISLFHKLGLTYGEADLFRRALDEVRTKEIEYYTSKIRESKSLPLNELEQLLKDIENRIGYSFNKSHAIEYALISYWTMYFKVYYPIEFCMANLNRNLHDQEKISLYARMFVEENNKKIFYGNVNTFTPKFERHNDTISFGYICIKGFSEDNLEKVIVSRPYSSFEDYLKRSKAKKNITQVLIDIGLFDNMRTFENE